MSIAPELVDRFRRDLTAVWPGAFESAERLGLAVSGGGDSLALLVLAHAVIPDRIMAATVDHGLRSESGQEAAMVARLCGDLGVPHDILAVTLDAGNVQERARAARYRALADWCARRGLWASATAHQLDDQAETIVMRLNRGSGLAGLAGVRSRGILPGAGLLVLRPLLGWRRAELADLVEKAGFVPARDASNEDIRFDRIRVRRALAETDWLDPVMLARSAALLGDAEAYVNERIESAFAEWVTLSEEGARLVPGQSEYEAVELCARIIADFGGAAARSDVAGLVARLRKGENASLAGVLARVVDGNWMFAAEPPRRS